MTTTTTTSLEQTRRERDRFVAFSFAAADVLLEIDPENANILYISGAIKATTGFSNKDLLQHSFFSFVSKYLNYQVKILFKQSFYCI